MSEDKKALDLAKEAALEFKKELEGKVKELDLQSKFASLVDKGKDLTNKGKEMAEKILKK